MHHFITQEKESLVKSEKILELQEKFCKLSSKLQLEENGKYHFIDVPAFPKILISISPLDPYIADLLKVADNKMTNIHRSLEQSEKEISLLLDSIQDLKKQVGRMDG